MHARIYQPARNAMQSGTAKVKGWRLEFFPSQGQEIDPLMGWTSSSDTQAQVHLNFETFEAAETYAREHGIAFIVQKGHKREPNIRPGGYGENFSSDRRTPWTH